MSGSFKFQVVLHFYTFNQDDSTIHRENYICDKPLFLGVLYRRGGTWHRVLITKYGGQDRLEIEWGDTLAGKIYRLTLSVFG